MVPIEGTEDVPEGEGMYDPGNSLIVTATGSGGKAPLVEGTTRGIIVAAISGGLAFLQIEFNVISAEGAVALAPVVIGISFVLGGLWDKFVKSRIISS